MRLPRQRGQHHVVELLHAPVAVDGVRRFSGPRKLDDLRATTRGEHWRDIRRQPSVRFELPLGECGDGHVDRAHHEILSLEARPARSSRKRMCTSC